MREKQLKVVGLGEVLFDVFPSNEKMLGGAPANFAYISSQLGDCGILASRVGKDSDGNLILLNLKNSGVDISNIQFDSEKHTGKVEIFLKNGQPKYKIVEDSAWDFLEFTDDWKELANSCDAVCFGSLCQRNSVSRNTIRDFLRHTNRNCLRIFDTNLRQNYFTFEVIENSLKFADILKLNDEELQKFTDLFSVRGANEVEQAKIILEKFDLQIICLTRGANGSLIISENEISEHRGFKTKIENTVGAGDAFTATLAHGLLRNWNLDEINEKANKVGAFVASKKGAMPVFSELEL